MTNAETVFVGLKSKRDTIDIAFAPNHCRGEDRFYTTIPAKMTTFAKVVAELQARHKSLYFVYEAGSFGYDFYHFLSEQGIACDVIAPVPKTRITRHNMDCFDRDALELARLQRTGGLTPICVPHPEDEAMRDLVRCCEEARLSRSNARRQIQYFLKRSGVHHDRELTWSYEQLHWLDSLTFSIPAQTVAFKEYLDMLAVAGQRLKRLEQHLEVNAKNWRMWPLVESYQALRGVHLLAAVTMVAELGDLRRFDNPRKLQNYAGLNPDKNDSRNNKISEKAKNAILTKVLIEAAWAYSKPAGTTSMVTRLLTGLPRPVVEISRKAELRLCTRYRELMLEGTSHELALAKIARELLRYAWSISQEITFH